MQNVDYGDLTAGLNHEQRVAATTFDKPMLVLAGSGTGKTHILATKVQIAMARGIPADRIMAVTFSRRAAKELRDRIEPRLGPEIDPASLWIGTFHALSTRILRESPALSPIGSEFTTLEDTEVDLILGQALRRMQHFSVNNERTYKSTIKSLKGQIDKFKNDGLDINGPEVAGRVDRETATLMKAYQTFLRDRGNADYGDLIVSIITMMQNASAKRAWSNRWDLMLVDEYQDINTGQGLWIDALRGDNTAFTAFGDDDQVIYQWRGANPDYIRRFGSRNPDAQIITLNTNYRSPRPIVEAAANLIRNNAARYEKDVTSAHANQDDVKGAITVHAHSYAERHQRIIGVLQAESIAFDWKDMMILTRINAEAAEIATKLRDAGIPANLIRPSANDVPLMRKLSAWLRFTRNPNDATALATLVETTGRTSRRSSEPRSTPASSRRPPTCASRNTTRRSRARSQASRRSRRCT
jgi:DNA helicase II / ATP-dependent DNA helicase PcrA